MVKLKEKHIQTLEDAMIEAKYMRKVASNRPGPNLDSDLRIEVNSSSCSRSGRSNFECIKCIEVVKSSKWSKLGWVTLLNNSEVLLGAIIHRPDAPKGRI